MVPLFIGRLVTLSGVFVVLVVLVRQVTMVHSHIHGVYLFLWEDVLDQVMGDLPSKSSTSGGVSTLCSSNQGLQCQTAGLQKRWLDLSLTGRISVLSGIRKRLWLYECGLSVVMSAKLVLVWQVQRIP